MRLESLERVSPANSKRKKKRKKNAFCTLTAKSWHCTYWDGWQLLFISVQQNLFQRWLRPLRTRTPAAKCIKKYYTELKWTEYLIRGCSLRRKLWSGLNVERCLTEISIALLRLSSACIDGPLHRFNWGMCCILSPTPHCSPFNKHSCAWQNLIAWGRLILNLWSFTMRSWTWYVSVPHFSVSTNIWFSVQRTHVGIIIAAASRHTYQRWYSDGFSRVHSGRSLQLSSNISFHKIPKSPKTW